AHLVAADVRFGDALDGLGQCHIDVVEAALDANLGFAVEGAEAALESVVAMKAQDRALVALAELVAVARIIEKIGEVVVERERTADGVSLKLGAAKLVDSAHSGRQAITAGIPPSVGSSVPQRL